MIHVGKSIRKYRRAIGMTQWELSQAVGITPAAMLMIERGITKCPAELLDAIASTLGIKTTDLKG